MPSKVSSIALYISEFVSCSTNSTLFSGSLPAFITSGLAPGPNSLFHSSLVNFLGLGSSSSDSLIINSSGISSLFNQSEISPIEPSIQPTWATFASNKSSSGPDHNSISPCFGVAIIANGPW